ncbi:LysM peptidoglycan-binding domain-containing protein [Pueribacillus sp. YX66]|uniref:cell division suppressor protein YneA n=1 Tax=Pueribacillus sp. YX66 TaxID=3229242 RepID=UPI00358D95F7
MVYYFSSLFWYSTIQLFSINVEDYQEITLEPGDTLWGIAEQYGHNPIRFAQWVEENNNVDAFNLKAGQTVYIPVKKGD